MKRIYLVAWGDSVSEITLTKFDTKKARDSFIEDLKGNYYSFCTTEIE